MGLFVSRLTDNHFKKQAIQYTDQDANNKQTRQQIKQRRLRYFYNNRTMAGLSMAVNYPSFSMNKFGYNNTKIKQKSNQRCYDPFDKTQDHPELS